VLGFGSQQRRAWPKVGGGDFVAVGVTEGFSVEDNRVFESFPAIWKLGVVGTSAESADGSNMMKKIEFEGSMHAISFVGSRNWVISEKPFTCEMVRLASGLMPFEEASQIFQVVAVDKNAVQPKACANGKPPWKISLLRCSQN